MKVKIAKNSGFCFGVKRAIRMAQNAAEQNHEIVTLGPIIHNPQMVEKLAQKGISVVKNLAEIKGRATIIRSHGVKREILQELQKRGIEIINATCPYVSKTQEFATQLDREGYQIIILGDKDHPEVIGLRSYVKSESIIFSDATEIPDRKIKKAGIICQTTRNIQDLQKLVYELIPKTDEMRVINTICNATSVRQQSTIELAKESDLMIVVGGKNSSNTKMLAKISGRIVKTYHIETADEMRSEWIRKAERIGLTAGASTPDWIILDVYNKIIETTGEFDKEVRNVEDIPGFKEEK